MNDNNVTPDENAPEDFVVRDETPVATEKVHTDNALVEPAVVPDDGAADANVVHSDVSETNVVDSNVVDSNGVDSNVVREHTVDSHAEHVASATVTGEVVPVTPVATTQTVYVTAPTPPRPKGNRGMGTLLAIVATIVFAIVYAGAAAILILVVNPNGVASAIGTFVGNPLFYVPVLVFLVMMILWALLANRASWWSWVIGSLVIALVTYFASIGVLMLLAGGFGLTAREGAAIFVALAVNPVVIAAALVARECAIWFGAAIAKRGRSVRERNYAAWQTFETEEAQKRAEFGGVAAV